MHILLLSENFPPEVNAVASRVHERAVYWVRDGHEVTIVTCFPNFPQGRLHEGWRQRALHVSFVDGIRVIRVPTYMAANEGLLRRTIDFASFMVSAVVATPRLPRADVVVGSSPQFFAAVAAWIIARIRRKPFVFEIADLWPASVRAVGAVRDGWILGLFEKLELFLYRQSMAVVALTDAFKRNLVSRGIAPEKIHVVINGVDLLRYAPQPRDKVLERELGVGDRFVIGYIGTLGMAHGLENVIEAAERLRSLANLTFMFVGDGACRAALEREVSGRELTNVIFAGQQPKNRIAGYWSVCDIALVHLRDDPVFADVIPSKMFEAMGMGLPILLVAPSGEASRILETEGAGIWVNAGDPLALADAARRLMSNRMQRAECSLRSAAAAERYSRRRQAIDMCAVLVDATHESSTGAQLKSAPPG
jgi:glycosyltransferase involved in cell wall biosynthesis